MRISPRVPVVVALVGLVAMAACSLGGGSTSAPTDGSGSTTGTPSASGSTTTSGSSMHLVVLGDSIARGATCETCSTYPYQVATAMSDALGTEVEVTNDAVDGAVIADTLELVRTDDTVRDELADADAVILTIGYNDLAFARIDDPCGVEQNFPEIAWTDVTHGCIDDAATEANRDFGAVLDEIQALRADQPTMVRVTQVYNNVIGNDVDPGWDAKVAVAPSLYAVDAMNEALCSAAEDHGAICVDTHHALNGEDGLGAAGSYLTDYTHLSQEGHDAFAQAIIEAGFAPLG